MVNKYVKITISCTSKEEIEQISDLLLKEHLIAGSDLSEMQSNYWWSGKIDREKRYTLAGLTKLDKKDNIIELVKKYHSDETPGVVFSDFSANKEFLDWIDEFVS